MQETLQIQNILLHGSFCTGYNHRKGIIHVNGIMKGLLQMICMQVLTFHLANVAFTRMQAQKDARAMSKQLECKM